MYTLWLHTREVLEMKKQTRRIDPIEAIRAEAARTYRLSLAEKLLLGLILVGGGSVLLYVAVVLALNATGHGF